MFGFISEAKVSAGEFKETVAKFLREFEIVDEARNLYGVRDILREALARLEASEEEKLKAEMLAAFYLEGLEKVYAEIKELKTAIKKAKP